ncbi:hypothetical protein R1sor_021518 [Riccia sorocarpa]|uniref:Reverse transcriptase domain-containing protein n=1 Tax=Riccia sorocarpa TaxID=122646 RepID=A0ABD3GK89_9MARC
MSDGVYRGPTDVRIATWNVGGLRSSPRKYWLRSLIRGVQPHILAVQELRVSASTLQFVRRVAAPTYQCFFSMPDTHRGGVALFLSSSCTVHDTFVDPGGRFVWCVLTLEQETFGVIAVYASNFPNERQVLWRDLKRGLPHRNWVLLGDLNCTEVPSDSSGNSPLLKGSEATSFYALKSAFSFVDVRNVVEEAWGPPYTRFQHTVVGTHWSVLDRIYLSTAGSWIPRIVSIAHHAGFTYSDHLPVILTVQFQESWSDTTTPYHTYFKVDPFLLKDAAVQNHLQQIWADLQQESEWTIQKYLTVWYNQRTYLKQVSQERRQQLSNLKHLEAQLQRLHNDTDLSPEVNTEIHRLTQQVKNLLDWEHHRAFLYSRVKHLREGEASTRYFHSLYRSRLARTRMRMLKLDSGEILEDPAAILDQFTNFYEQLYQGRSAAFIKADFEKAYDRVSPQYILLLLHRLQCGSKFTNLVQGLLTGASATIYLDGQVSRTFAVNRGVRQGCPLAPLLFAISTIPLVNSLMQAARSGRIQALQLPDGTPVVTALYADDTAIFLPLHRHSFQQLQQILQQYCDGTGARLNLHKSEVCILGHITPFPPWLTTFNFKLIPYTNTLRYLGYYFSPSYTSHQPWQHCFSKMLTRLNALYRSSLSFEARFLLTRHELAAIPMYFLPFLALDSRNANSHFQLTLNLLWGASDDYKPKKHLVQADFLAQSLQHGGLGLRKPATMQAAFWAKLLFNFFDDTCIQQWKLLFAATVLPRSTVQGVHRSLL